MSHYSPQTEEKDAQFREYTGTGNEAFNYQSITELEPSKSKMHGDYLAIKGPYPKGQGKKIVSEVYVSLGSMMPSPKVQPPPPHCVSELKFHISLDDHGGQDEEHRGRGWDIIKDILIENKVALFKVVCPGKTLSDSRQQQGKDITIYTKDNPEISIERWEGILRQISYSLRTQGVRHGLRTSTVGDRADTHFEDNPYVSYRYEAKDQPPQDYCRDLNLQLSEIVPQPVHVEAQQGIIVEEQRDTPQPHHEEQAQEQDTSSSKDKGRGCCGCW